VEGLLAALPAWLADLAQATAALLIVVDPVGLLPIVVGMTRQISPSARRVLYTQAVGVGLVLLLGFTLLGVYLLDLFRITVDDFKIAGGILLLVVALTIVTKGHWGQQDEQESAVVPLATPLLTGPGAITTSIVLLGRYGVSVTITAILITYGLTWLIMQQSIRLLGWLGETGSDVVARIMGMLLAAIAVQFIREGLQSTFALR